MIKATELRIGNVLFEKGRGAITINGAMIKWLEEGSYRGIEPIEITEEWLLKFGFEKNNITWEKDFFLIDSDFDIQFENAWADHKTIKIQFVHQLQNLYFALCGEELTLNSQPIKK